MPFFDSEFLKKLEYLALISRRVFRGQLLAQRRTRQLGGGVEFADHREYAPGDDFRHVDWGVFARHDELLLKRFQEEQDLHVYVLLDGSRSMATGEPLKFDYARQVAAALAYIALDSLDRVAISTFAADIFADFPLTRGKNSVLTLLRFLENVQPSGRMTDLAAAAEAFVRRRMRHGVVVVISDLFDLAGFERGLDLLRHHRYEPHLVVVHDPREAAPDFLGDVDLIDIETETVRKVTVTERNLRQYRELFEAFLNRALRYCRAYGLSYSRTTTDVRFDEFILKMMRMSALVR